MKHRDNHIFAQGFTLTLLLGLILSPCSPVFPVVQPLPIPNNQLSERNL